MLQVFLFPYLSLRDRLSIGRWELIPAPQLEDVDCVDAAARQRVLGLLDLYHRSRRVRDGFGCVVKPARVPVGSRFVLTDLSDLRRALIVGLLERTPGADNLNAGHAMWTSDNADLTGHRVSDEGYVSTEYGAMAVVVSLGMRIGDVNSAIEPPAEMPFPILARDPDADLTEAVFAVLRSGSDVARRVRLAIDWLDLAWRNSTSTSHPVRLVMLKSGFEVLLDATDGLVAQRAELDRLLASTRGRRSMRPDVALNGQPRPRVMSDLGWWFTQFTYLRNAIAHGDVIPNGHYRFGHRWHLWIAEARLREAIKETVACEGYPLIRLDFWGRAMHRARHAAGWL